MPGGHVLLKHQVQREGRFGDMDMNKHTTTTLVVFFFFSLLSTTSHIFIDRGQTSLPKAFNTARKGGDDSHIGQVRSNGGGRMASGLSRVGNARIDKLLDRQYHEYNMTNLLVTLSLLSRPPRFHDPSTASRRPR
jgi:hypothetical protein